MKTALLVHHGRPHFEIILALSHDLRDVVSLSLWSDALDAFDRIPAIERIGLPLHRPDARYDYIIVISGDALPPPEDLPPEIGALVRNGPTLRVKHRFSGTQAADELFLVPMAPRPFLPVSTGLESLRESDALGPGPRRLLVQGNIENRRNYGLLSRIAAVDADVELRVCGLTVAQRLAPDRRIRPYLDLPELDFHGACAGAHFILPLIDPVRYRGYFTNKFSSSILIGMAYQLPFIAHRALFDLYPIAGYAYRNDKELIACVTRAAATTEEAYAGMVSALRQARATARQANEDNVRRCLDALSADPGAEGPPAISPSSEWVPPTDWRSLLPASLRRAFRAARRAFRAANDDS